MGWSRLRNGPWPRLNHLRARGVGRSIGDENGWHAQHAALGPLGDPLTGREPLEITSGEVFMIEVAGELKQTRMEYRHLGRSKGEYYSVDGYALRDGLRAGFSD